MEVTLLPSPLMQKRGTMLVREIKIMEERVPKEETEDVTLVTNLVTMQESAPIKGTLPKMMTTTTTITSGGVIKETISSKERGRLPLIKIEMEMVNLSSGQEIQSMINPTLLIIREMNIFLYMPSLMHLLPTP